MVKLQSKPFAMNGNSVVGLIPNDKMGNDDLSWETTKTFNVGIDFGFLNNRISGNVDFYSARTSGLLLQRNLPILQGYDKVYSNMGKTANHGVELTVNTRNIDKKDFKWNSSIVFSWNHNEIKELYGDGKDDIGNRWFIGEAVDAVYDYDMVGIWQEDEIERGDHLDWDPVAQADDVKLADRNMTTEIGYWTPENKSNKYRSLKKQSNKHGYGFYEDASFTRIKDITLGYTFPENWINKLGISALTVYASGRNLVTWTDWIGWDPETRQDARGSDNWETNYPYTKSYVFGLNVTF